MSLIREQMMAFCTGIGRDPLLVQGAGGNVSWKEDGVLWVKASGTWLADAAARDIFVPVALPPLLSALERGDTSVEPTALGKTSLRPSIETLLHALMPHRVVAHLHAIDVLAVLVRKGADAEISEKMKDFGAYAIVDYFKPGPDLAQAIRQAMKGMPQVDILFLKSHGLVIGANDMASIKDLMCRLLKTFAITHSANDMSGHADKELSSLAPSGYGLSHDSELHKLATDRRLFAHVTNDWALYPDHVVFLGARPVTLPSAPVTGTSATNIDCNAPYLFFESLGVLERANATPSQRVQLRCYLDVIERQPPGASLASLSPDDISGLLNWTAEQHRQKLNEAAPTGR